MGHLCLRVTIFVKKNLRSSLHPSALSTGCNNVMSSRRPDLWSAGTISHYNISSQDNTTHHQCLIFLLLCLCCHVKLHWKFQFKAYRAYKFSLKWNVGFIKWIEIDVSKSKHQKLGFCYYVKR